MILFGAVVDKSQPAPFFQDDILVMMRSIITPKLRFFSALIKMVGWQAIVFAQDAFGLVSEIFNPIDMIAPFGKHR
ncbi:MAG: hypothetical protein NPIRA01_16930 [Nitrospirales bacterium]|nr:MAG: hypothetical protein NPIRA01_16930 [Nitrospirales bacterium]